MCHYWVSLSMDAQQFCSRAFPLVPEIIGRLYPYLKVRDFIPLDWRFEALRSSLANALA